ncbi:epsilon tubulin, putative, partial [Trypanosoma cruzi]
MCTLMRRRAAATCPVRCLSTWSLARWTPCALVHTGRSSARTTSSLVSLAQATTG